MVRTVLPVMPRPGHRVQVAPAFTTENGIVRVQIRHPSSPLWLGEADLGIERPFFQKDVD